MATPVMCINCQTPHDDSALYCVNCGIILAHALEGGSDATRSVTDLTAHGRDLQWGTSYFHHRARLFFSIQADTIQGNEAVIPVRLEQGKAVIGRSGTLPVDVDLTPFGAAALGVSRRHIVIERVREVLHVTDLGSNNGTHLNRERLVPHTPYTLRNRAVLELGKLILRVQYM